MFLKTLGEPVTGSFEVSGGSAQVHERGLRFRGQSGDVEILFDFPSIGVPTIATGAGNRAEVIPSTAITFKVGGYPLDSMVASIRSAFEKRIALIPTARTPSPVPLVLGDAVVVQSAQSGAQATHGVSAAASLDERVLYDIAVKKDDETWQAIAPHAVYYRASWHDFGIAHVTDIHAARRIEFFVERFLATGRDWSINRMINWNDRFRGFIRYANYMHDRGLLDIILATGDIVDYLHEEDDTENEGNPSFARSIILGQWPTDRFRDVEELRVPIFMIPGNHDYRRWPYHLIFNLDLGLPGNVKQIRQFSGYRMNWNDAAVAQGFNIDDAMPSLSAESGARALTIDPDIAAYRTQLADKLNYVVKLGSHRIVMLDSGHDVELPTNKVDLVQYVAGEVLEGKKTAIDGSPNSQGVSAEGLKLAVDTLSETPEDGLFILGLHAPLFNMWKEEYPYFFRESQRTSQETQATRWIARHSEIDQTNAAAAREKHPEFFERDGSNPAFVMKGDPKNLMDFGVSRGASYDLLRALAGINQRRAADLVLHGHIHRFNEFRLAAVNDEVVYYMDWYTDNLSRYYPTRFVPVANKDAEVTYVEFATEAPANNQPTRVPTEVAHDYVVSIPPFAQTLNASPDPKSWWAAHRPLVLQTEALGPFKDDMANLAGFRLITVKSDVISRIDFVSIETLAGSNYKIEWEDVIRPDPMRSFMHSQRSMEFGTQYSATDPAAFVVPSAGSQTIVYTSYDGHLFELWRDSAGRRGFGDLTVAASGSSLAADSPSCYVDANGTVLVLYRGTDNHVHTLYWSSGAPGHDALSYTIGAPPAAGTPVGFYNTATGGNHVVYRSPDNHLQLIYWQGANRATHDNLTAGANALLAKGNPSAYLETKGGTNIVVYRGADDHIWSIYWSEGPSGVDDLSGVAGAPPAVGNPVAYYIASQDVNQVAYRATDNHIHELWWIGANRVADFDVTAAAGAPAAASDPHAWYSERANKKHIAYIGVDRHLYVLRWTPAGAVECIDMSVESWGPPPMGKPFGFVGPTHEHLVYRGTDNQIHEIRWADPAVINPMLFNVEATLLHLPQR